MDFIEAFCWVEVLLGTEMIVCCSEVVEGGVAFGSHGVRLGASESFEYEGGGYFPSLVIQAYLGAVPGIDDGVIHVG